MFTVVCYRPGSSALEATPISQSVKFSTAAVGGFASCSFQVIGDRRRDFPHMSKLRVLYGMNVVWEGRVEQPAFSPADQPAATTITCQGFQRLLTDVSVRRIWSMRSMSLTPLPYATGSLFANADVAVGPMDVNTGQFNPADLSKLGVRMAGNGTAVQNLYGNGVQIILPNGLTAARLLGTFAIAGANTGTGKIVGQVLFSATGLTGSWSASSALTASGSLNMVAAGQFLMLIAINASGGSLTPSATDTVDFSDLRLLGTSLTEDASGGFYGGTILRDLMALIPGMGLGLIEAGSDFLIPSIERSVRDTLQSVVNEVIGYYQREWAIWEGPTFQWVTPSLDTPQWIVDVAQLQQGTVFQTDVDQLFETVYVLYAEASDPLGASVSAEQSALAVDPRNPLTKLGATKDKLQQAPAVMTDNTASQLAAIAASQELYPPVTGTVVLNVDALIRSANSSPQPAALIRAGTNIYLPGLPKSGSVMAAPQRDGETLFHVVSSEVDMELGTQTLQLEGQTNAIAVLNARLAAVTRVVTG